MRILIYGINYAPELTGIGKYTGEMAEWFANEGHTVDVITAMPYYPEWNIHKKYRRKWWHKEQMNEVTVYRCLLYVPKKITSIKRIIHEFSFIASTFPVWVKKMFTRKYDTVICVSPPFHLGFLPLLYCKIRNVNLITHIQDLQVDAAKNLAMLKNGRFLNMMFGAEKFILKRSTLVSTISPGMLNKIKEKNIPGLKTTLFPNWRDDTPVSPLPTEMSMRKEFGFCDDDKIILYSGNLGEKQGLDIIIDVAKNFSEQKKIHFLIVGSGGNKEKLEKQVKDNDLKNIRFYPLVAAEKLSALLASADIHLVLQKKSASDLVMPSKLSNILATGGCAIVTASPGTYLYEVVDKNKVGILIKPESPAELTSAIAYALTSNLDFYRTNARRYAMEHLSKEKIMKNFESVIYSELKRATVHTPVYNQPILIKKEEKQTVFDKPITTT